MTNDEVAILATKKWVEDVVVGLNFCPFANREVQRKSIRYLVSSGETNKVLDDFLNQVDSLEKEPNIETTVLILDHGYEAFDDYLELLAMAQMLLEQSGYAGIFQLASFHPNYLFEGEPADSPSHYTNRAPYPVIHLLRESSISRVNNESGLVESIPQTNIDKCEELGIMQLKTILSNCFRP